FEATDALSFLLSADGFNERNSSQLGVLQHSYPFLANLSPYVLGQPGAGPYTGFTNAPVPAFGSNPFQHAQGDGIGFTTEYRASDALSFKNIVGYRESKVENDFDCDHTPYSICDTGQRMKLHNFSEELQASLT